MWGLAILVVLWVLVAPAFALISAAGANRRARELDQQLRLLRRHFDETVEKLLGAGGAATPAASPAPVAIAEPTPPAQPAPAEVPAAAPTPAAPAVEPTAPLSPHAPLEEPLPPLSAPTAPPAPPARPAESLESKIGARWSVLVGGLALALGAVFLVRYSIEQGLIGPGTRIALGFLLAAILFGLGEWLRRRDRRLALPVFAKADVPAILTGAAGIALFATIYAAHALYGFIGPAAAFVLLTAAGLVTLALSVIHGPALAALGALGSYAAPLLVASTEPAPFPLVLHTLAVTASVLGMARIRGWRWLAAAGIIGGLAWGIPLSALSAPNVAEAELLLVGGLAAIFIAALLAGAEETSLRDRPPEPYSLAALGGLALLSLFFTRHSSLYPALFSGIVLTGILGAVASRWTAASGAALIAGALAVLTVMLLRQPQPPIGLETMRFGEIEWYVLGAEGLGAFALKAAALALVAGVGGYLTAERMAASAPRSAGFLAAAGAAAPLLILVTVYLRHVPFETRPAIGIAALVLAALYATMTERLIARRPADDKAPAPALYAAGAVLALSFAFAVGLATRFIPVALSLGAAGVVWVSLYRPVRLLSWLAVVLAALACVAIATGSAFTPEEIGTRPILNGLILRLGLPAAAVAIAGEVLSRRRDGIEAAILQTLGLVLAAIFVAFEIRHVAGGGDIRFANYGLGEQSAYTLAALAFALGLQKIAALTGSRVHREGSLVAGIVGALGIGIVHLVIENPFFTDPVGSGHFFNLLLPGYLLPALAAAMVAAAARPVRPRAYVLLMAALSLALAFAYVTLMVRHAFRGEHLDGWEMRDAENWTYSAVWLAFGILLLAAGILLRSTMVRAASGIIIAVVVCKVFLFDMAALTGVLRAASFLGLGAVLIAIGRLYQRLLMHRPPATDPAVPSPQPEV